MSLRTDIDTLKRLARQCDYPDERAALIRLIDIVKPLAGLNPEQLGYLINAAEKKNEKACENLDAKAKRLPEGVEATIRAGIRARKALIKSLVAIVFDRVSPSETDAIPAVVHPAIATLVDAMLERLEVPENQRTSIVAHTMGVEREGARAHRVIFERRTETDSLINPLVDAAWNAALAIHAWKPLDLLLTKGK